MKLAIFDLDGTLFDTKNVNYNSYKYALDKFGYTLDYEYFCTNCNGKYYLEFLPDISTKNVEILKEIHDLKMSIYYNYLDKALPNVHLFKMIDLIKSEYKIALVTTASRSNTRDLLSYFNKESVFDLIITKEDVVNTKPNPEGFLKAMNYFSISPNDTIIFEDSVVGIKAAQITGASVFTVLGFN